MLFESLPLVLHVKVDLVILSQTLAMIILVRYLKLFELLHISLYIQVEGFRATEQRFDL